MGHVGFNSIVVRLKVDNGYTEYEDRIRFNSIVVRLKDVGANSTYAFTVKFQFHSGSIKRHSAKIPAGLQISVSIP